MTGYLESDQSHVMLAYDNPHTGERVIKPIPKTVDIDRMTDDLTAQGAKCGYWSLRSWQLVKRAVTSGRMKL